MTKGMMRIVFIGNVEFSLHALERIVALGGEVVGVCTKKTSKFNTDHVDLTVFSQNHKIDSCYADDINSEEVYKWISTRKPDIIFCIGWSQILKKSLINLPPLGVVGYHPAALPANRGRHPIVWALALGLKKTASTFFYINDDVDAGDIISQSAVQIDIGDDASTLYCKLVEMAKTQIDELLPRLVSGSIAAIKQDQSSGNVWRKRGYIDGQIDWRMTAEAIHNLVRALTRPYPGAHFIVNGQEVKVWRARVVQDSNPNLEPGKITDYFSGAPLVKCGSASICLLEIDPQIQLAIGSYL